MIRPKEAGESVLILDNIKFIEKYKREMVVPCKKCEGTGIRYKSIEGLTDLGAQNWKRCKCFKKFLLYYGMVRGNISEKYIKNVRTTEIYPRKCKILQEKKKTNIRKIFDKYTKNLNSIFENGIGLFITGDNGCGKTTLSHFILYEAVKKDYYVYYITLSKLLSSVIKSYKDNEMDKRVEEIMGVDFLVIDELGKEPKQSRHSFDQVETLLRERAASSLPTILLTNLSMEEFKNAYGDSIWSVIQKEMLMVHIKDKRDFRQGITKTISEKLGV